MKILTDFKSGLDKTQGLIFVLFFSCFFMEFLEMHGLAVRQMTWIPDLLSIGLILVIVVFVIPKTRVLNISLWYVFLFLLLLFSMISGIILNSTEPTVIITGVRNYLKYIPFFLLPVVYKFSDVQIRAQFKFILLVALVQLPISLYQRLVVSHGLTTGDHVRGTLPTSSYLSIFLISVFVIILGFRMCNRLSIRSTIILAILILFPTTINETKGTLILLPIALLTLAFFAPSVKGKLKYIFSYALALIIFLAVFIPVYDHFFMPRYGKSITLLFTDDKELAKLVAPNTTGITEKRSGRGDKLLSPFAEIEDPFKFLFGLSIGNISDSFLGSKFTGEYYEEFDELNNLAFLIMMYELGLIGTLICIMLIFKIAFDAYSLSKCSGFSAEFALGWIGVVAVILFSLGYKNIIGAQAISYLFWFYSGYVASQKIRVMRGTQHDH